MVGLAVFICGLCDGGWCNGGRARSFGGVQGGRGGGDGHGARRGVGSRAVGSMITTAWSLKTGVGGAWCMQRRRSAGRGGAGGGKGRGGRGGRGACRRVRLAGLSSGQGGGGAELLANDDWCCWDGVQL